MFNSFWSDVRNQDTATTAAQSKHIIKLLKKRQLISADISTIWNNIYGCSDQYICDNVLYLISMLAYAYNIIIDGDVGAPVHGREVIDGLNTI